MQGVKTLPALSQSTFREPAILRERDTKKQKTKMKKLIMKLLGLNVLIEEMNTLKNEVLVLTDENKELKNRVKHLDDEVNALEERVQDKIDEIEEPDVSDQIESYLNDNDYVSSSYVDDEIESKVSDKVEEAIEELDIEDKVKEVVDEMDKPSFCDTEELKDIVRTVLRDIKIKFE